MTEDTTRAFFDFTDPLSYLTTLELSETGVPPWSVIWTPFELRPPPLPVLGMDDEAVRERWAEAGALAAERGIELRSSTLVPWSRKAHELYLHAYDQSMPDAVREAIFSAYFREGRDIGRVDVLVDIAHQVGLDRTESKAVLDVDKYEESLVRGRALAESLGVTDVPAMTRAGKRLEGFHNRTALRTFLLL